MSLLSKIPREQKVWLKAQLVEARRRFVQTFLSFDAQQLLACLRSLGVRPGDSVMLHSAFGAQFGFRGSVEELTNVFLDAVGPEGNLLMVSLPYRSSSFDYLSSGRQFDVRKTPSMMGLVSEFFRRRPGVLRSLHPTHPILAYGPKAEWFVAEHPNSPFPCGPGTPFDRLVGVDGKALFYNVPFATFTFFHYLEHLVSPDLPFPLYLEKPAEVQVIDAAGAPRTVRTFVFAPEVIPRRRFPVLEEEMEKRHFIHSARVGASRILAVKVRDAIDCVSDMRRHGRFFYDMSDLRQVAPASGRPGSRGVKGAQI